MNDPALKGVELKKRQIFRLEEKVSTVLVHETVKRAIEDSGATGLWLHEASEFYSDIVFD